MQLSNEILNYGNYELELCSSNNKFGTDLHPLRIRLVYSIIHSNLKLIEV